MQPAIRDRKIKTKRFMICMDDTTYRIFITYWYKENGGRLNCELPSQFYSVRTAKEIYITIEHLNLYNIGHMSHYVRVA